MYRKKIKQLSLAALIIFLLYAVYYWWISFPIATGYGAKVLCSAVFVSGRDEKDIKSIDLDFVPLTFASCEVDYKDSSASCSMLGMARRKAIYKSGAGAVLVNDLSEEKIRARRVTRPPHIIVNTDTVAWPMGDKLPDTLPSGIDTAQLARAMNRVFHPAKTDYTNQTRALIVLYNGQIVAERYAPGFTAHTRLTGWSMTKSITGALAGILVKEQKLDIDSPAPVPEWKSANDPRHSITTRHLLQQTSGLEFEEVYTKSSHANRMLFMKGDAAAYAASQVLIHPPGEEFHYSSGNTNIISRIFREQLCNEAYHSFPYEQLFYKLGMYSAALEADASGTFVGSSFCYATARDWARFGLLYLNEGKYNGVQLLPEGWVKRSVFPSDAAKRGEYGFQWWLNVGSKDDPSNRLYPGLPADMFFADGYEGQNIFIVPSKKLVVVRLGLTRNSHWGEDEFLLSVIKGISE